MLSAQVVGTSTHGHSQVVSTLNKKSPSFIIAKGIFHIQ